MAQTFNYSIVLAVAATLQDEEIEECRAEVATRLEDAQRAGYPQAVINGITLERVIMDRTVECAQNALHVGIMQHAGALIVVESREPLHV